jgi:hypothetical protein
MFCRAVILLMLGGVVSLAAQSSAPASQPVAPTPDSTYPEKAHLSPDRYTNEYFDFSFQLPADARLRPISLPASRNGNIQILELGGPPPADAAISIAAIPMASGNKQSAKTYLRESLDQELYRGVEELRGLSKANFAQHQFFLFETRRGIEQHVILATTIGDYILEIVVSAHDEKMVKRLETAVEHLEFFPPSSLPQYVLANSKPYDGPAISSHRLEEVEQNPPAKEIDPGKVNGDFYENAMLGFSYRVPQGWVLKPEGVVQPAIEKYRSKEDFGRPRVGRSEHILMDSCSRTLFSAWAKAPDANGEISYDDFGEVTVSAVAMSCFSTLQFPKEGSDPQAFKDFVGEFSLTHPIVEDMGKGKVFSQDGIVFIYLHGTVAFQIPNDALSRRLSLAMAITERRGYLLTWFFAAPHDSELIGLTNERAIFDNAPAVSVASASKAAESKPAASSDAATFNATETLKTAAPANATSPASDLSAANPASPGASSAASSGSSASSAADPQQGSSDASSGSDHPSLLRPGENVDSQQGKGPVIKPK